MKACIGSGKTHRTVFPFSLDITMLKKWFYKRISSNWENISKSRPKVGPKIMKNWILMKRCIGSAKPHVIDFRFFARYYEADGERISWNWEIISKSGPKARPIIMKIWILMKRCIGPQKPHRTFFRFFARYYDAEEEIHKRISWNWENISNSEPKIRPKIMKNWSLMKRCIGFGKPHRTFFPFSKDITMLKKWFLNAFPELGKISQNLGLHLAKNYEKLNHWREGASDTQNLTEPYYAFSQRYYGAEEVIHQRISWNWENILTSGPKFGPIIIKNWMFDEEVPRIPKTSQQSDFRFFARYYDAEEEIHKRL